MIPNTVNLPTIWRGCEWGPVTLKWKDANGDPLDLTLAAGQFWVPKAHSLHINLHASVTNRTQGITHMVLSKELTADLRLGVEKWDWLWERTQAGVVIRRFPPFLTGKITIKDPISTVGGDTPPGAPDTIEPPEGGSEPPSMIIDLPPELPS